MKYRFKLVLRYETLKEKYKIIRNKNVSRYKDVQTVINKILRLTKHLNYLKNYTSINAKLNYLKNGFAKCAHCQGDVLNYRATCCSYNCANTLRHIIETPENKKLRVIKAAETRDYEKVVEKRLLTMATTIDEFGNNLHKLTALKAAETMKNNIEENGLSIAQNRSINASQTIGSAGYRSISDNAVKTRKKNGINSSLNYWSSMSEEEKNDEVNKRSEKAIITKIENETIKPIEDRDAFNVYCSAASFKHGFETKCAKQKALLKEYGGFNTKNNKNTNGCVRDHLLSRRYGFDNNIATWIISHPANCEIVLNSENIRRAFTNDNLITLEELLERIENWNE